MKQSLQDRRKSSFDGSEDVQQRIKGSLQVHDLSGADFAGAWNQLVHVNLVVAMLCGGTVSFLALALLLCKLPYDRQFTQQFYAQVPSEAHSWPMTAFFTTFSLNVLALLFERRPARMQLCFTACYITLLAGLTDMLAWHQVAPIYENVDGRGLNIVRLLMWAHATPAMLYALSVVSDLSKREVATTIVVDIIMILASVPYEFTTGLQRALWWFIGMATFPYILHQLWIMFTPAIAEARDPSVRNALQVLRGATLVLWTAFPVIWVADQLGFLVHPYTEMAWCIADFLGKAIFSTSLLHGNYVTLEQRRLVAMRVVEESNRVAVLMELRELVEQKERFTTAMGHELLTPLNGVIGLSDALLSGGQGPISEAVKKTIRAVRDSGLRLQAIVASILDAASMRQSQLQVRNDRLNISQIVDDVIELTRPLAQRGVRLANNVWPLAPHVVGERNRVIQILHNLIGNACKYTYEGAIWVDAIVLGDKLAISVHDSGIGVPMDKVETIFVAYEQIDMSNTRRYGGTGLGLTLVKHIVEAHGGEITVHAERRVGSTFTFTLQIWNEKDSSANVIDPNRKSPETPTLMTRRTSNLSTSSSAAHPDSPRALTPAGSLEVAPKPAPKPAAPAEIPDSNPAAAQLRRRRLPEAAADASAASPVTPSQSLEIPSPPSSTSSKGAPTNAPKSAPTSAPTSAPNGSSPPRRPIITSTYGLPLSTANNGSSKSVAKRTDLAPSNSTEDLTAMAGTGSAQGVGLTPSKSTEDLTAKPAKQPGDGIKRVPSSNALPSPKARDWTLVASDRPEAAALKALANAGLDFVCMPSHVASGMGASADGPLERALTIKVLGIKPRSEADSQLQTLGSPAAGKAIPTAGTSSVAGCNAAPSSSSCKMLGPSTSPDKQAPQGVIAAPGRPRSRDGLPKRALSVDDDPVNQLVMTTTLKVAGYQVKQALSGPQALEMLTNDPEGPPDVMLLDVMMPGMDGHEVCRRVRGMEAPLCLLPIIMISANSNEQQIVEGLSAGSNDYVTKPFGRRELIARIDAQLRAKDMVERFNSAAPSRAGSTEGSRGSSLDSAQHALEEAVKGAVKPNGEAKNAPLFNAFA